MEENVKVKIQFPKEYLGLILRQLHLLAGHLGYEIAQQIDKGEHSAMIVVKNLNPILKTKFKAGLEERGCKVLYFVKDNITTIIVNFQDCKELQLDGRFEEDKDEKGQ